MFQEKKKDTRTSNDCQSNGKQRLRGKKMKSNLSACLSYIYTRCVRN